MQATVPEPGVRAGDIDQGNMEKAKACGSIKPVFNGPVLKTSSSSSKSLEKGSSPVSAKRLAAAHSAQMDATMAAVRADHDAKIAELMAELEGLRGEKEKTDTDLAFLKATARKERLEWNNERRLLTREVAEAERRAREAGDGLASAQEFLAIQQSLASHKATIDDLRRALEAKEAQENKLQFEVACASTAEADVDRLMVRVASLEKEIAKEIDARITAEQETEALSAEVRSLERKLNGAQEAVARAGEEVEACVQDIAKANAEVREAHAAQRHTELWLEKSLAEVDAVTAMLEYERSMANGANRTCAPKFNVSNMHTPLVQQKKHDQYQYMPPPVFHEGGDASDAAVEGSTAVVETPLSITQPPMQESFPRTPDLGTATGSTLCAAVHTHPIVGEGGRGGGSARDEAAEAETEVEGVGRQKREFCSPPTPTVLFAEPSGNGKSKAGVERTATRSGGHQNGEIAHQNHAIGGMESPVAPYSSIAVIGGGKIALSGKASVQEAQDEGNRGIDNTASMMSLLLSETRKRAEAEARIVQLERETAVAMAVAAASAPIADGGTALERVGMTRKTHAHRFVGAQARESSGTGRSTAGDDGGGSCSFVRPHQNGDHGQLHPETYTRFARMDQGRQRAKILGLVRDARKKMQMLRKKEASAIGGFDWGLEFEDGCAQDAEWAGGSDVTEDESAWDGLDPATEVASLIHLFEGKLTHSIGVNNQLRDFCAHLEGLLALNGDKQEGVNSIFEDVAPRKSAAGLGSLDITGHVVSPSAVIRESLSKRKVRTQTSGSTPFPDVDLVPLDF